MGDPLTLKDCPELSCLEIFTIVPRQAEHTVISSITSINLRTITFLLDTQAFPLHDLVDRSHHWNTLDNILCALVDKLRTLGHKHTLELRIQLESAKLNAGIRFRGLLPKFKERGRVRILSTSSGDVVVLVVRFF